MQGMNDPQTPFIEQRVSKGSETLLSFKTVLALIPWLTLKPFLALVGVVALSLLQTSCYLYVSVTGRNPTPSVRFTSAKGPLIDGPTEISIEVINASKKAQPFVASTFQLTNAQMVGDLREDFSQPPAEHTRYYQFTLQPPVLKTSWIGLNWRPFPNPDPSPQPIWGCSRQGWSTM